MLEQRRSRNPSDPQSRLRGAGRPARVGRLVVSVVGLIAALIVAGAQQASAANAWVQVDAGSTHTCAIRTDHTLWCWGTNDNGQLGLGTRDQGSVGPAQVGTDTDWASVSAGSFATCALKFDGTRWCMGWNGHGQLGVGDFADRSVPTNNAWELRFTSVAVGDSFACGIATDERRFCWGSNYQTRIGMGSGPIPMVTTGPTSPPPPPAGDQALPVVLPNDATRWTSVSTASGHSCGLVLGGARACWGPGGFGKLGLGSQADQSMPSHGWFDDRWNSVTAGGSHSCGVMSSYRAYCWGRGHQGQLGNRKLDDQWVPVPVLSVQTWASLEAGDTHTCGLTTGRTLYCWGTNDRGQLGLGDTGGRSWPGLRAGEQTWSQISAGLNYTCGITTTSFLYCWGANSFGQLGIGNNADQNLPVRVEG